RPMERERFRSGEQLWLCGREVTFVAYSSHGASGRIGSAVVCRDGGRETRDVPLWILARDQAESVARANAIPAQLASWASDSPTPARTPIFAALCLRRTMSRAHSERDARACVGSPL